MKTLYATIVAVCLPSLLSASQYWGGEMPDVSNASVTASVRLEENVFYYEYAVTNPASNTGEIWSIDVDITKPRNTGRVSSQGLPSHDPELWADRPDRQVFKEAQEMVPVGMFSPSRWSGGLSIYGTAGWGSFGPADRIYPGQSLSGLQITSYGPPGIREIMVEPDLVPPTMEQYDEAEYDRVEREAAYIAKTLGPTAPPAGSARAGSDERPLHYPRFLQRVDGYITSAVELGWLTDKGLAGRLHGAIQQAEDAYHARDITAMKTSLNMFMAYLQEAPARFYTSEGYGLLYFNARYIADSLP